MNSLAMFTTRIHSPLVGFLFALLLCLVSFALTNVAYAQETAAEVETSVEATQTPPPPRKPLPFVNKIKAESQSARENLAEKRKEAQEKLKETRAQLQDKRKDMRRENIEERKDMRASTTEARKDMRKEMADDRREFASTTRVERKELQEGRRLLASSTREARKEVRDDRREMIKNEVIKRAQMQFELIVKRLGIAIDRLDNISGRIDSRIAKLKADGVDTGTMESLQAAAKVKVNVADDTVRAIKMPELPSDTESTTSQTMNGLLTPARAQIKAAEMAIKDAQTALNAVVAEMKSKGKERAESETASSEGN